MRHRVVSTFGALIHEGTKSECDLVIKALTTYGISEHKFELIELPVVAPLTETVRNKLKEKIAEMIEQGCFGDGMERDYAWDGVVILGANEMTDAELIETYEQWVDEDDDLLMQAKGEFILEQVLAGERDEEEA